MTTHVLTLLWHHDDVRDNNAFFVGIMFTLMAIKSSFERSYDKQNITLMVISPKARLINFIRNDHECNILYILYTATPFSFLAQISDNGTHNSE